MTVKSGIVPGDVKRQNDSMVTIMRMIQDAEGSQLSLCKRLKIPTSTWGRRLVTPGDLTFDEMRRIKVICQEHRIFFDPFETVLDLPYRELKRMLEDVS